jgi:hypothetical protein
MSYRARDLTDTLERHRQRKMDIILERVLGKWGGGYGPDVSGLG